MPKVTDTHRQARREQIIRAAYRCFGRQGFHQTSMRDICQEADLSAGAVYNYFDGKEDLLRAVAVAGEQSMRSLFEGDGDPENGGLGALLEAFSQITRHMDESPEVRQSLRFDVALWAEAPHAPDVREVLLENTKSAADLFTERIRAGQERGEIRADLNAEAVARLLLSFYQGLAVQKTLAPDSVNAQAIFSVMSNALRTGLESS